MKKFISMILVFAIFLTVLSGCKNSQTKKNGELTIATLFQNQFLELAARRYEELNNGVKININVYSTEVGQQMRDSEIYSQTINTALMSGMGEDIIDVSRLSWVHLADKNKLLDLNGKIDFMPDAYYQNILDAYLYNGKRYAIPLCFTFDALIRLFDKNVDISFPNGFTLEDLLSLADKYPESPIFYSDSGMFPLMLAYRMFCLNIDEFIDVNKKEANVDNEKFIHLLESVNSITYNLRTPQQNEVSDTLIRQLSLYTPVSMSSWIDDYTDMFLLANGEGKGLFSQFGFLPSINANSENTELAVDFVQFLLSDEMQSSPELMYCPVNINAVDEIAALTFAEYQPTVLI